jgi:hypothetical protein
MSNAKLREWPDRKEQISESYYFPELQKTDSRRRGVRLKVLQESRYCSGAGKPILSRAHRIDSQGWAQDAQSCFAAGLLRNDLLKHAAQDLQGQSIEKVTAGV